MSESRSEANALRDRRGRSCPISLGGRSIRMMTFRFTHCPTRFRNFQKAATKSRRNVLRLDGMCAFHAPPSRKACDADSDPHGLDLDDVSPHLRAEAVHPVMYSVPLFRMAWIRSISLFAAAVPILAFPMRVTHAS